MADAAINEWDGPSFDAPGDPDEPNTQALQAVIDALTPSAIETVINMRRRNDRIEDARENNRRRRDILQAEKDEITLQLAQLKRAVRASRRTDETDAEEAKLAARIEKKKTQIAKTWNDSTSLISAPLSNVLEGLRLLKGPFADAVVKTFVRDGLTSIDELKATDADIDATLAELNAAKQTPRPVAEMKAQAAREIEAKASKAKPSVDALYNFRTRGLSDKEAWGTLTFPLSYELGALASKPIIDTEAMFFWLHKDELIKWAHAEIGAHPRASESMTAAERAAKLKVIEGDLLNLYYRYGAFAAMAEAEGKQFAYRNDVPVTALLGVVREGGVL